MNQAGTGNRQAAIRDLIAVRAYEIWENQGCPHGQADLNWHQAEQEILGCIEDQPPSATDHHPARASADL